MHTIFDNLVTCEIHEHIFILCIETKTKERKKKLRKEHLERKAQQEDKKGRREGEGGWLGRRNKYLEADRSHSAGTTKMAAQRAH